jgi:hypothetical protein
VIVVRRGGGGDDANGSIEPAGKLDDAQIRLGHSSAKFCAACKEKGSHVNAVG